MVERAELDQSADGFRIQPRGVPATRVDLYREFETPLLRRLECWRVRLLGHRVAEYHIERLCSELEVQRISVQPNTKHRTGKMPREQSVSDSFVLERSVYAVHGRCRVKYISRRSEVLVVTDIAHFVPPSDERVSAKD